MVLITRRDAINRRLNKSRILAPLFLGIICLIVPIIFIIVDPIHAYLKYKLRLAKGSLFHDVIQQEISADHLSLYLFNITNAARYLAGVDSKIRVEEVGPFVFKEYRSYSDIQFSDGGDTMSMSPTIRSEFVPELSIAHPKDMNLTVLNLPLLSLGTLVSGYGGLIRFAYNMLVRRLDAKPILNLNVEKFLWGYEDPIMTLANKLVPGMVYFDTLGLLDRFYDYDSKFKMEIGATNKDKFKIKSVKKYTHLQMGEYEWVDESEQVFNDTYEGCGYPPDLTPEVPLNLYRLGICKTFNLQYEGSKIMDYGGEAFVYSIGNKTFQNEETSTLPYGLVDVSRCYYNLPYGVSKGHFLDADPALLEHVDGLKPDRDVHVNRITIDRRVAVTMDTEMSLQLNILLGDLDFNSETQKFTNSVIPIVHIKVKQVKLSDSTMSKFYLVYSTAPKVMVGIEAASFLLGLAFLGYTLRSVYLNCLFRANSIVFESAPDKKPTVYVELPLLNGSDICR